MLYRVEALCIPGTIHAPECRAPHLQQALQLIEGILYQNSWATFGKG